MRTSHRIKCGEFVQSVIVEKRNAFDILKQNIPRSRWEDYCVGIRAEAW